MSDPAEIYLQPECCADEVVGRMWCDQDAPVDCEDGVPWTKYVIAARVRELEAERDDARELARHRENALQLRTTERDALRAENERLRALLLKSYCYVVAHVPIGVKTDNDRKVLMLDIDAALKETP